jgi:hypothetical protein
MHRCSKWADFMKNNNRCADTSMRGWNAGKSASEFTASMCGLQDSSHNSELEFSLMSAEPRLIVTYTRTGDVECAGHVAHL